MLVHCSPLLLQNAFFSGRVEGRNPERKMHCKSDVVDSPPSSFLEANCRHQCMHNQRLLHCKPTYRYWMPLNNRCNFRDLNLLPFIFMAHQPRHQFPWPPYRGQSPQPPCRGQSPNPRYQRQYVDRVWIRGLHLVRRQSQGPGFNVFSRCLCHPS